jgi:hypothetical protein
MQSDQRAERDVPVANAQRARSGSFRELLTEAVNDLARFGYLSERQLQEWMQILRAASERELGPDDQIDVEVREAFERLFGRFVDGLKLPERVPGVQPFTKALVKSSLYAELDRRILAAADLIKLHRAEAIEATLRRFQGWATAIPVGGDDTLDRVETKTRIGKELTDYRYQRRLVNTDQGHKLIANVANLVATEAGAIAGIWQSHGATDARYDARKAHLARHDRIYLIRDSWAHRDGLVRPVHGYTDDIDAPAQAVNCRCHYVYVTSPRRLPDAFLTAKGQAWVAETRRQASKVMTGS